MTKRSTGSRAPEGASPFARRFPKGVDPRIERAFALLREGERLVETLPPAAAIARFAEKLGWTALAAARDLGESRAGNLLKALAAARKFSAEGLAFSAVVGELARLREEDLIEQMSLEPGRPGAVRLMTLHGAKGLEAPVVFLADPTKDRFPLRDYFIDRSAEPPVGHFVVSKGSATTERKRSPGPRDGTSCSRSREPSTRQRRRACSTSARPGPGRCSS